MPEGLLRRNQKAMSTDCESWLTDFWVTIMFFCVFAGILRTAVPDMDRETQDQYLVVLQAKDMGGHLGGLSGTTTVTVKLTDVNDNPPRFTQSEFQQLPSKPDQESDSSCRQ